MSNSCEGKIASDECLLAPKEFENGKSPGSDGFTAEVYKFFWKELSENLTSSLNHAFEKGELSICQRREIISLLPKKSKPTNNLNNLRPISLLNTDYKRLERVLPFIVNPDQTGYIKGRYISENIRLIIDLIDYTKQKNIPGIAIFFDFRKAFDSVEWDYIAKVLDVFNFGEDFKRWVKVFILIYPVAS